MNASSNDIASGWTGGQYSLLRALLGLSLFVSFAVSLLSGGGLFFSAVALAASVALAAGVRDRIAAAVVCVALACLFARHPSGAALPLAIWMLLAHLFVPAAPYGAADARGRVDPRGDWHMPAAIVAASWIVLSLGYAHDGVVGLSGPVHGISTWSLVALELGFAPLAFVARTRPFAWAAMLSIQLVQSVAGGLGDFGFAIAMLHFLTFDPRWLPGTRPATTDDVFYDGTCGVCHGAVRFLLAEDARGSAFRFAPLGGDRFHEVLAGRGDLPDSIVVRTEAGAVLVKSDAALHLLSRLGGAWRVLGGIAGRIPRPLRDSAYDAFARIRYRLVARPEDACPILPPDLRARFSI